VKVSFDPATFFGGNILHEPFWIPPSVDAARETLANATAMRLSYIRMPIPMELVVQKNYFTEDTLLSNISNFLDVANEFKIKIIISLCGYTAYNQSCGYQVGYIDIEPIAAKVIKQFMNHPALFAWDLLNEPLSNSGCNPSVNPSVIQSVTLMQQLIRSMDPNTPITVGEAYPNLQSTWNHLLTFASPHIYFPAVHTPVTPDILAKMKTDLAYWIEYLKAAVSPLPLVIGEFGFDASSFSHQVTDAEQAMAYQAYYDVLKEKGVGSLFWKLSLGKTGGFSVLQDDGTWKPAANVVKQNAPN